LIQTEKEKNGAAAKKPGKRQKACQNCHFYDFACIPYKNILQ
jgi:hypothetical protein